MTKNTQTQRNSEILGKNNLTAISRLKTSHKDAPLIHIIQELRDNCVISEVRINKEKLQKNQLFKCCPINGDSILKAADKIQKTSSKRIPNEPQEPTAPAWEKVADLEMSQNDCLLSSPLEIISSKNKGHTKRRNIAGGRLLQKRLSKSNFSFKPPDTKEPPAKPPRSSMSFEENLSTSTATTSLSVREAERVVDNFLVAKGYTIPMISKGKSQGPNFKSRISDESPKESYINRDKWSKFQLL